MIPIHHLSPKSTLILGIITEQYQMTLLKDHLSQQSASQSINIGVERPLIPHQYVFIPSNNNLGNYVTKGSVFVGAFLSQGEAPWGIKPTFIASLWFIWSATGSFLNSFFFIFDLKWAFDRNNYFILYLIHWSCYNLLIIISDNMWIKF